MPPIRRRPSNASSSAFSSSTTNHSDSPRPTLADIPLRGRKRLRDGSIARTSRTVRRSSSLASSVPSTSASSDYRPSSSGSIRGLGSSTARRGRQSRGSSSGRRSGIAFDPDTIMDSLDYPPQPSASPPASPPSYTVAHDNGMIVRLRRNHDRYSRSGSHDTADMDTLISPVLRPQLVSNQALDDSQVISISDDSTSGRSPDRALDIVPSASSSDTDHVPTRRYTAKEKGKGKANPIEPIEITDEEDNEEEEDGFTVTDVKKRKRSTNMGMEKPIVTGKVAPKMVQVNGKELVDEDQRLAAYTCPVCFCAPDQPVMTLCGHVLCEKCLFESLLAAVKRQVDPMPDRRPPNRGRGKRRGGGGRASSYLPTRSLTDPKIYPIGGPISWTVETLKLAWYQQLERVYYRNLAKVGMPEESWEAAKEADPMAPAEDRVDVVQVLRGVWAINGDFFVIEGECPVCRKQLPGGYGPEGIGGIVPLRPHIAGRG